MIDNFLAGTATLFGDPFTIAIFVFGVIGGMLFGAIPGVSMLTLAAILLPFTADLSPAQGVMLFAVIYCTGTYGGAITAALFLRRFAGKNTNWAHIDVMAWNLASRPGRPKGGEAMGLRALYGFIESFKTT